MRYAEGSQLGDFCCVSKSIKKWYLSPALAIPANEACWLATFRGQLLNRIWKYPQDLPGALGVIYHPTLLREWQGKDRLRRIGGRQCHTKRMFRLSGASGFSIAPVVLSLSIVAREYDPVFLLSWNNQKNRIRCSELHRRRKVIDHQQITISPEIDLNLVRNDLNARFCHGFRRKCF